MSTLEQQIIETLKVLQPRDRDLKTITVSLNPNYNNGSDTELREIIKYELDVMVKRGIIRKDVVNMDIFIGRNGHYNHTHKKFIIYSLKSKF